MWRIRPCQHQGSIGLHATKLQQACNSLSRRRARVRDRRARLPMASSSIVVLLSLLSSQRESRPAPSLHPSPARACVHARRSPFPAPAKSGYRLVRERQEAEEEEGEVLVVVVLLLLLVAVEVRRSSIGRCGSSAAVSRCRWTSAPRRMTPRSSATSAATVRPHHTRAPDLDSLPRVLYSSFMTIRQLSSSVACVSLRDTQGLAQA